MSKEEDLIEDPKYRMVLASIFRTKETRSFHQRSLARTSCLMPRGSTTKCQREFRRKTKCLDLVITVKLLVTRDLTTLGSKDLTTCVTLKIENSC